MSMPIETFLFNGLMIILSATMLWIAKTNGFFTLPQRKYPVFVPFISVVVVFSIYLGIMLCGAPLLLILFKSIIGNHLSYAGLELLQCLLLLTTLSLFFIYAKKSHSTPFEHIIKDKRIANPRSRWSDFFIGSLTWWIGFPLVFVFGQITDFLLHYFLGFESYEQVAVHYLKSTTQSPFRLSIALTTIVLLAPIIEEFLFRGCLQSFFKRFMSTKIAILLSSIIFALFHYSHSQGLGNISLFVSLFIFALFLGFIYEKRASLFSSVGLHMTFNAFSALNILFLDNLNFAHFSWTLL